MTDTIHLLQIENKNLKAEITGLKKMFKNEFAETYEALKKIAETNLKPEIKIPIDVSNQLKTNTQKMTKCADLQKIVKRNIIRDNYNIQTSQPPKREDKP